LSGPACGDAWRFRAKWFCGFGFARRAIAARRSFSVRAAIADSVIAASHAAVKRGSVSAAAPTAATSRVWKAGSIIATASGNTVGARAAGVRRTVGKTGAGVHGLVAGAGEGQSVLDRCADDPLLLEVWLGEFGGRQAVDTKTLGHHVVAEIPGVDLGAGLSGLDHMPFGNGRCGPYGAPAGRMLWKRRSKVTGQATVPKRRFAWLGGEVAQLAGQLEFSTAAVENRGTVRALWLGGVASCATIPLD